MSHISVGALKIGTFSLCLLQYHPEIHFPYSFRGVKERVEIEPVTIAIRLSEATQCEPVLIQVQQERLLGAGKRFGRRIRPRCDYGNSERTLDCHGSRRVLDSASGRVWTMFFRNL